MGNTDGTRGLASMYQMGLGVKQDYREACRLYKIASDKGFEDATDNLGNMYKNGQGVKQDYREAFRL